MVSGILHETGRISSRFLACGLLLCALVESATASPLFEENSVLDVQLQGPLRTIVRDKKDENRQEYPFTLTVDGIELPLDVRVRGKSRVIVCEFPPLRLRLQPETAGQTVFRGQGKLKLVTHCKSNSDKSESNLLEEYTAYRIFNLISDIGYRVRLLRVRYVDTEDRLKGLDRSYFAFLIESDSELAARTGAEIASIDGVPYSRLSDEQTALLYVFQYLIGNFDWSFVLADDAESCCHNVGLIERNGELFPVPYDFDRSGLVNARYAKPPPELGIRRSTQRVYRGYCKTNIEEVASALDKIVDLKKDIMSVVANSPEIGEEDPASRAQYIGNFFEQALLGRDEMLEEFGNDCLGPD